MTVKSSAVRFPIDAANLLRTEAEGAVTAATPSGHKSLGTMTAPGYHGQSAAKLDFAIVIFTTAIKTSVGDEAYEFDVEVADNEAFTGATVVSTVSVKTVGHTVVNLAKENVGDNEFIRVVAKPTGTLPSIDYFAQLGPLGGK